MKILFLTRLFYPHIGGVEKHVEKLSLELLKKGNEVTIITTNFNYKLRSDDTTRGIKLIRFNQPKIKYFGILYTWFWMIKNISLFENSDIVHIHDVFIWYWPIKLLLPFKKVSVTFHGQWGKYPIGFNDILQKKVAAYLSVKNICIGEYIPKNYGINADILTYGGVTVPNKISEIKNYKNILYVGRLDSETSVNNIFKVFKKLKSFNIQILGDGILKKEAKKYGKVLGFIDPAPYYKKAKFVFASGYLTILEALANKCLVFTCYDNPLQRDYYKLTPFRDLIISERDPEILLVRFQYYLDNQKEANKIIENGYKWSTKQSWEKLSGLYINLWSY
jgi:glycosyltransferase involved in cell wall biosynthesis